MSSTQMVMYGGVRQQPYAFQDNAMGMVDNITDLRVVVLMQLRPNKSMVDNWRVARGPDL